MIWRGCADKSKGLGAEINYFNLRIEPTNKASTAHSTAQRSTAHATCYPHLVSTTITALTLSVVRRTTTASCTNSSAARCTSPCSRRAVATNAVTALGVMTSNSPSHASTTKSSVSGDDRERAISMTSGTAVTMSPENLEVKLPRDVCKHAAPNR